MMKQKISIASLCQELDISVDKAEKSLHNLAEKGLVNGYIPGELHAEITLTSKASVYFKTGKGRDKSSLNEPNGP